MSRNRISPRVYNDLSTCLTPTSATMFANFAFGWFGSVRKLENHFPIIVRDKGTDEHHPMGRDYLFRSASHVIYFGDEIPFEKYFNTGDPSLTRRFAKLLEQNKCYLTHKRQNWREVNLFQSDICGLNVAKHEGVLFALQQIEEDTVLVDYQYGSFWDHLVHNTRWNYNETEWYFTENEFSTVYALQQAIYRFSRHFAEVLNNTCYDSDTIFCRGYRNQEVHSLLKLVSAPLPAGWVSREEEKGMDKE